MRAERRCEVVERGEVCGRKHYGHGFCYLHWKRWRKHGDPLVGGRPPTPVCGVVEDGEVCGRDHWARGMCSRHWKRWWLYGDPLGRPAGRTVEERFCEKFEVADDGCWPWVGARDRAGYGMLKMGRTTRVAHRVAYELAVGPIPDGLEVDHLCFNPSCVNPDHLEAVTPAENVRRAVARRQPVT